MRADIENLVTSVEKSLELLRQRMDWDTVSHRLEEFDARVENPNLWDNPEEAQKLMRERQTLLDAMEGHNQIRDDLSYNIEMIALGEEEEDSEIIIEAEKAEDCEDQFWWLFDHGFSYYITGDIFHGKVDSLCYGDELHKNDIIDMWLDLRENYDLRFARNGKKYGKILMLQ